MKGKISFLIVLILVFGALGFAQKKKKATRLPSGEPIWNIADLSFDLSDAPLKITPETIALPKEFYGHNFIKLFANLEKQISLLPKDATVEQKYQGLKNKKILGNLTVDDYFIFQVQRNSGVSGYSKDFSRRFRAVTFQLRPEKRIEAITDWVGTPCIGGDAGTAPPTGEAAEDFVKTYKDDSIWEKSYLLINTVKPIYSERNYKGKKDDDPNLSETCRGKTIVPSPQAQYELAFTKPQPFELAASETVNLSLKDYEYKDENGVGVIAWSEKGEKLPIDNDDYIQTFFVVKLTAPFIKSEILEAADEIENKELKMFSRAFYVDIESLWIVSNKTGKIVKRTEKIK